MHSALWLAFDPLPSSFERSGWPCERCWLQVIHECSLTELLGKFFFQKQVPKCPKKSQIVPSRLSAFLPFVLQPTPRTRCDVNAANHHLWELGVAAPRDVS